MSNKVSKLGTALRITTPKREVGDVSISFSQFSMWSKCPRQWKLTYIDKHRISEPNINLVFGTAFHETIQHYIYLMYSKSIKDADAENLNEMLLEQMMNHYGLAVSDYGKHFSNKAELTEYYNDGVAILDWLKKHRRSYFTTQDFELLGIELPLYTPVADSNVKVKLNGFLDLVLRDTRDDSILIIDFKTSRTGWRDKDKKDKVKIAQLVLYKEYLAKQYGYDVDKINIQYFIVKRKLMENSLYPQKRIQIFEPASGTVTRKKLITEINNFVSSCFNDDGTYKVDAEFPAIADKGANCKYCPFSNNQELCPKNNRI
jgi:hypothetical protein